MNAVTGNLLDGLSRLIANTPMVKVDYTFKGRKRCIFAKAENFNMTGSIKDRMAFHIIQESYRSGKIKEGDHIIEATSGNTGISFAAIGRLLDHPVTIYMPDWLSLERVNIIKSYGADIRLVSKEEGGFLGSIEMAERMARRDPDTFFLPRQFSNHYNSDAHFMTTGKEIYWQLQFRETEIDAFVAGVGTGGTIMGAGRYFKRKNPRTKVFPLEPANSPTLSTGHKIGKHRIQGISDEFIPEIVNLEECDKVIAVDDGDSIIMAQKLASRGLGVGISSGSNFIGAAMIQNELGDHTVVATVFPDDNKKYLSTDLMKKEPVKPGFLSPDIEITSITSLKRLCYVNCEYPDCPESHYHEIDGDLIPKSCSKRANVC
jgi:cysteine synthase